jgi:hypothetical protein
MKGDEKVDEDGGRLGGVSYINTASHDQQVRLRKVHFGDRSRGAKIGSVKRGGEGV